MEKAEEASSWDPQCTTPELKELIEILTLGCWPFMHAYLRRWKIKAFLTSLIMFTSVLTMSLEEFIQQMNNQPVSTPNNQSPLQMWERGMLENMHSGHTAPSPKEIDDLGVDLEGVLLVENCVVNIFRQCVGVICSF